MGEFLKRGDSGNLQHGPLLMRCDHQDLNATDDDEFSGIDSICTSALVANEVT